jgi:hypothetical protein
MRVTMKNLIILITTFLTLTSNVNAYERIQIEGGDKALDRAHVEMIDQSAVCPRGAGLVSCMAYGSKIQLKITLNGCLDRLGPVFHHVEVKKHKAILYVAAVNIHTQESEVTRCVAAPTEFRTITIPYEGRLEVRNMAVNGEILPAVDPVFEPSL